MQSNKYLTESLISWYMKNARALPWRTDYNPYHVLISEVMLQQTQMERGIIYFNNWIKRFPTIFDVANASEDEILKAWEGLGYYRRARYLHDTAKKIAFDCDGIVPNNPEILATFKGLGDYTVAAIASIAYNQALVSIDANVERVFARLFCVSGYTKISPAKERIKELSYKYLPLDNARMYNQALMELGGLICKKKPLCHLCPLSKDCQAFREKVQDNFPSPAPAKNTIKEDWLQLLFITSDAKIAIMQRDTKVHWGGLYEFYSIEAKTKIHEKIIKDEVKSLGLKIKRIKKDCVIPYVYTNHKNTLSFYRIELSIDSYKLLEILQDFICIDEKELVKYAFPSPHNKAIKEIFRF